MVIRYKDDGTGRCFVLLLCYGGNLEPLNKLFWSRFTIFTGGCLQEPNPVLRYVLDECVNGWINENWENLKLYHMKNNAAKKKTLNY